MALETILILIYSICVKSVVFPDHHTYNKIKFYEICAQALSDNIGTSVFKTHHLFKLDNVLVLVWSCRCFVFVVAG